MVLIRAQRSSSTIAVPAASTLRPDASRSRLAVQNEKWIRARVSLPFDGCASRTGTPPDLGHPLVQSSSDSQRYTVLYVSKIQHYTISPVYLRRYTEECRSIFSMTRTSLLGTYLPRGGGVPVLMCVTGLRRTKFATRSSSKETMRRKPTHGSVSSPPAEI